jgi:hypothetical protein
MLIRWLKKNRYLSVRHVIRLCFRLSPFESRFGNAVPGSSSKSRRRPAFLLPGDPRASGSAATPSVSDLLPILYIILSVPFQLLRPRLGRRETLPRPRKRGIRRLPVVHSEPPGRRWAAYSVGVVMG